jgi:hypothetical protein
MITKTLGIAIEGSKIAPSIIFTNGVLSISGRSIPHDSTSLYAPLLEVLYNYAKKPNKRTEININLDYLNSDSNRALMNLLILAEKLHRKGNYVVINWYYNSNDTAMYDQGNIFQSLIDLPFRFEPLN